MVQSNYNTIDDFIAHVFSNGKHFSKYNHLAFIILENHEIPWSWYKEKLTQLLCWNMQGGVTGAGSGHLLYFCKGDIHETLRKVKDEGKTHAMVCQVGMVLSGFANQVTEKTPIQNFYEFVESDQFMRAHILARSDKPARIHQQHFEINLTKWDGQDIVKFGTDYVRSKENIHDDYTPYWIEVPNLPRIDNFTPDQRTHKWFTYPHRNYEEEEQKFYDYVKHDKKTSGESSRVLINNIYDKRRKKFYYENNEKITVPEGKYDVIIAPSSGYIAEILNKKCGHENTEIIIYDYDESFLETKKKIIAMGLVGDDLFNYMKHLQTQKDPLYHEYMFKGSRMPNQQFAVDYNERVHPNPEEIRESLATANVKYKQCNLLEDNFQWIEDEVKNKSVLFYASNIFSYYMVSLFYDYSEIYSQYERLREKLKLSNKFFLVENSFKERPKRWWCPLPFTSLSSNTQGHYALCCEAKESPITCNDMSISEFNNSEYMQEVKQAFLSDDAREYDIIKDACKQCILKEEQGAVSKRIRELQWKNKNFLELKLLGNICNYACIMCNPRNSSVIAEQEGVSYPKYFDLSDDWWSDFDKVAFDYTEFRFASGEPFMSPTFNKIIKRLEKIGHTDIKLQITTNGSASPKVIKRLLETFKKVSIIFSVDAWGKRNELIRINSDWDFREDRLWDYGALTLKYDNLKLIVSMCVNVLNIGYVHDFDHFLDTFTNKLQFSTSNTLAGPEYLNAYYLPREVKDEYLNRFTGRSDNPDAITTLLKSEYKGDKFKKHLDKLSLTCPNWREWWPEFIPYEK